MGFLLHPIRTLFLIGAAFLAGVMYEKQQTGTRCLDTGGDMQAGVCRGVR